MEGFNFQQNLMSFLSIGFNCI
uniref:Uncharacterized protein n=1 Tax=Arundo donax TaxID=35708 RepID=A0A0A8ZGG1_ARUDO